MKISKTTLAVCGIAIAGLAWAELLGRQAIVVHEVQRWAPENPVLSIQPKPLQSNAASTAPGTDVLAFGYEFDVPWTNAEQRPSGDTSLRISDGSGKVIIFSNPANRGSTIQAMYVNLSGQKSLFLDTIRELQTNYALEQAAVNWTPDQASLFMSRAEANRTLVLMTCKVAEGHAGMSGIFTLHAGKFSGFQFGDPATSPRVTLRLFDPKDRQILISFLLDKNAGAHFSQEEINRVIQTFKKFPPDTKDN
jgi:hypothetical protein